MYGPYSTTSGPLMRTLTTSFARRAKTVGVASKKLLPINCPIVIKNSVPVPIMDFIKPVFKSLSDRSLLRKCLHGQTQNPNESVNSVIWARLPKIWFVGIRTVHLGVYDAVSTFNCGNVTK